METFLIETIRIRDGVPMLAELHRRRMRKSCRELFGCNAPELRLTAADIPPEYRNGIVKCRVTYGRDFVNLEFEHYTPKRVASLRLVEAYELDYHLKYADRSRLALLREFRGNADDVVIIKDGLVTDTSYSNLLIRQGNCLLTPSRPLLRGVMRRRLLDLGYVREAEIQPSMILPGNNTGVRELIMINAMLPPGTIPPISTSAISW